MSGHPGSESVAETRWQQLIKPPRWSVLEVPLNRRQLGEDAMAEGWEPFAVYGESMWFRRETYTVAPPLSPQLHNTAPMPKLHTIRFTARRFRWWPESWPFGLRTTEWEKMTTCEEADAMVFRLRAEGAINAHVVI